MTRVKWKLASVSLEIVLILMQDRCTVCGECTMTHSMELLGDVGHVESRFGLVGGGVSVGTR